MSPLDSTQAPQATHAAGGAPDCAALVHSLGEGLRKTAESVVPWFLDQMPPMYFQDTSAQEQQAHLRAIIAARSSGQPLNLTLRSEDGRSLTAIRQGNRIGILAQIVGTLPLEASLRAAKIHTSRDGTLVMDTFEFGDREPFDPRQPAQAAKADAIVAYARTHHPEWTEGALRGHIAHCAAEYVLTLSPFRFCQQRDFYLEVAGTDASHIHLEPESDPTQSRITVVVSNARTRVMLERVAIILAQSGISVLRAYLDLVRESPTESVTFLAFVVQNEEGGPVDPGSELWKGAEADLQRIKWIDYAVLQLAGRHESLDVPRAEALVAFATLVHTALAPENPYAYGRDRVLATFEANMRIAEAAIGLFQARFDPAAPMADAAYERAKAPLLAEIDARSDSEETAAILRGLFTAIEATKRTNFALPRRFALSLRVDPALLAAEHRTATPYGVYFVQGRGFHGFHVRFREIARGGLRVVRPTAQAQYERESARLFDEVYGLAAAQQMKNKDIPEGGAKAAIVLEPPAETNRCVKAFVDSLLDLITTERTTTARIVDRLGRPELIYLGPDENITPEHIDWIVARARRRGYPMPGAFMSSKPGAGINHKEFGVTSEGVSVFLHEALRARGIDPTARPFTVKITGGPDGDVAGNMIRILHRDWGDRARIVGIADGSGIGEDPAGLDHAELLRLFREGLPIARFNPRALSPKGRVVPVDAPEGVALRNTLHNRLVTDAFVPGGGRPDTINDRNWREYLQPDGTPSSGIIVEGANLFLTPGARTKLSEAGVLIFKDSSANKCGVICSSFEILSSMLLEEQAFLAIKPTFVEQVLAKLRDFALREARLLLGERTRHSGTPLPELSVRISAAINTAADALHGSFAAWGKEGEAIRRQVVLEHVPAILAETVGDRLFTVVPQAYLDWMVAKSLASRIVYREGIDFFTGTDAESLGALILAYASKEKLVRKLVEEVRASGLANREEIARLLARAGTRGALMEGGS